MSFILSHSVQTPFLQVQDYVDTDNHLPSQKEKMQNISPLVDKFHSL